MKHATKMMLAVAVLAMVAVSAQAALVNHWELNETSGTTASDSVGSLDGTVTSGGTWSGTGIAMNGNNSYVDVGLQISNISTYYTRVTVGAGGAVDGDFVMGNWQGTANTVMIGHRYEGNNSSNPLKFTLMYNRALGTGTILDSDPLAVGTHDIALVSDGTSVVLYVDGEVRVSNAGASHDDLNTYAADHIRIGSSCGTYGWGGWNHGTIEDVQYYNTALTQAEVQALPEPATMSLLGIGGLLALVRRRRK